jgi:hypothetical protein
MKVSVIYTIPDTATYTGGKLYDKFGNLEYFADVTGLGTDESGQADSTYSVGGHTRLPYMRAKGSINVSGHARKVTTGIRMTKGALPGYTITLDDGTEKRDFQYTGTMSCLYAWLTDKAKVAVTLYGKRGTPYKEVPAAEAGF